MGLFIGRRDANTITKMAKEIVERVVDITVDLFKQDVLATSDNIYGESVQRSYLEPVRVNGLIRTEPPVNETAEFGYDISESVTFRFLRETLKEIDLIPEVGDVVRYLGNWFELTHVYDSQEWGGIDPDEMDDNTDRGLLVSVICEAVRTRESVI